MSYPVYLQLVLNIDRQRMQMAVAVARGMVAATPEDLGPEWADAIATDPSEIEPILAEANSLRARARARMKA